jgi:hypothetical protein
MIADVVLSLLLAAATAPAVPAPPHPNCTPDGRCADVTIDVNMPEFQTSPAPNVHLEHFEYVIPGQMHDSVVDYDQMLRLQEQLKVVAKANLAGSQAKFGVRVIYALTPNQPAQFKMQVAEAPPTESPRLKQFYAQASALKDFHCTKGMVYIVFDYRMEPATAAHHAKKK